MLLHLCLLILCLLLEINGFFFVLLFIKNTLCKILTKVKLPTYPLLYFLPPYYATNSSHQVLRSSETDFYWHHMAISYRQINEEGLQAS